MIRRLEWIRSSGIFGDFKWNSATPDFAKINVVYGSNGSGKTSLSCALDEASLNDGGERNISILMDEGGAPRSTGGNADTSLSRIHVFSDRFVNRSQSFSADEPDMDAILTIGERTVEADARLKELQGQLKTLNDERDRAEKEIKTADKMLTRSLEQISQRVVDDLTTLGGEYQSRSHYSVTKVQRDLGQLDASWTLLTPKELTMEKKLILTGQEESLPSRSHNIRIPEGLADEVTKHLGSRPSTIVLDTLKDHPDATSWVQDGRHLHEGLDTCIFCGSTMSTSRLTDIDRHFSSEVEELERKIASSISTLRGLTVTITDSIESLPRKSELYPDLRDRYEPLAAAYVSVATEARKWAESLIDRLEAKSKNVLKVTEDTSVPAVSPVDSADLDGVVSEHNKRSVDHEKTVQAAAIRIKRHYLASGASNVEESKRALDDAKSKHDELKASISDAQEEANSLQNVSGNPNPSAKVLNEEVARLLGRSELKFEADGERYRVTRNGAPASGLSEGERTAISLVHFMEMVARRGSSLGKPIVVIDDPVSSLDSSIFMGISTYIWTECLAKDHVDQLILLTHNFELFRQWDMQLEMMRSDINAQYPSQVYELKCRHVTVKGITARKPRIDRWPPSAATRKKVRSSYHHAFMEVAEKKLQLDEDDSLDNRLDAQLLFPNVIRRMLETFLAFKRPDWVGDLYNAMRQSADLLRDAGYQGDADALRSRLLRFANVYSHNDTPETAATINPDEVRSAMSATFEFMRTLDSEHFDGLCRVVGVKPENLVKSVDATSPQ